LGLGRHVDASGVECDAGFLRESMPCGKRHGVHDHAQIGDLCYMSDFCLFDYCESHLTGIFGKSILSLMKLSSFQSFARLDCLNLKTPFSSSCTSSCLMTSSISSLNGCV